MASRATIRVRTAAIVATTPSAGTLPGPDASYYIGGSLSSGTTPYTREDKPTCPPPRNRVLAGVDAQLADVLSRNWGVMRRTELEKACVLGGMNRSTFYVYLDYSPIICRYVPGVYGLRGVPVQPGVIEQLAAKGRRRNTRVLVDHGWTSDGYVWIGLRLSPSLISSGVFAAPAGLRSILDGHYSLTTPDHAQIGTIVIQSENPTAWGLSPLFRRRGGEPGDYLLLVFDLAKQSATASLGDETLLENPSGSAIGDDALPGDAQGQSGSASSRVACGGRLGLAMSPKTSRRLRPTA